MKSDEVPKSPEAPKPRPEGEPSAVVKLRELIETTLEGMVDSYACDEHGNYVLGLESARVFVVPAWLDESQTVIRVFAITNLDVPVTAELTKYQSHRNHRNRVPKGNQARL